MNGEHQKIFDAIVDVRERVTSLEATTTAHHEQNQKDMNSIGGLNRSLEKHCHEIGKLKVHRGVQWYFIAAIIITIIGVAVQGH